MLKTLTLNKLLNRPFTLLVQIKARNNWYKQTKLDDYFIFCIKTMKLQTHLKKFNQLIIIMGVYTNDDKLVIIIIKFIDLYNFYISLYFSNFLI